MIYTIKKLQKNWYEIDGNLIYGGMLKKFESEKEVLKFIEELRPNTAIKFIQFLISQDGKRKNKGKKIR